MSDVINSDSCKICGETVCNCFVPTLIDGTPLEPETRGFMPDYRHPRSRDWGMEEQGVPCRVTSCSANFTGKCVSPACIEIGDDGKCKGVQKKKEGE